MVTEAELLSAVDAAFEDTGAGLSSWPDPHRDRQPLDAEYSRHTDPGKWRIVAARVDAWMVALVNTGLARVDRNATVQWNGAERMSMARADRVVPNVFGALSLVVSRYEFAGVVDAGVTLGVGDPARWRELPGISWLSGR